MYYRITIASPSAASTIGVQLRGNGAAISLDGALPQAANFYPVDPSRNASTLPLVVPCPVVPNGWKRGIGCKARAQSVIGPGTLFTSKVDRNTWYLLVVW